LTSESRAELIMLKSNLLRTYGNTCSLFIGPRPAVVTNGIKAIREAIVIRSAAFAGRPQNLLFNYLTERKGVIFVDYGPHWKEHRRFTLMTFKNFGLGQTSMEDRINEEIEHAIKTLEQSIGKTLNPQVVFYNIASNVICQVLFGKHYGYDDKFIRVIIHCYGETLKITTGLWGMVSKTVLPKLFNRNHLNLVNPLLKEHKESRTPGEPRDLIDCNLDEMEKNKQDSSFSEDQLLMYVLDIHCTGTDTTSNTLLTAFFYLVNYPRIQEQCQQINRVLGGKDQISYQDMPYMQAVIHEVQRVANIVPLSVFHCTTKDTDLMGYSIPKGTIIIENMASALSEEEQEAFVPFSTGPRVCPGEALARMELFLVIVTLLKKFTFAWPEDAGEPDFTPIYGFTMTPKLYRMKVQLTK
uniref:Cytochrome P450 n=1 Tax=Gouania willdenowi TaxID=441366 RepID=A0A8C5H427_GOUWI